MEVIFYIICLASCLISLACRVRNAEGARGEGDTKPREVSEDASRNLGFAAFVLGMFDAD